MAKKKKKTQKGLLLAVLAGLLISIALASSQLSKDQSMNTTTRATDSQSCISQVYTYHGTGICINNIRLICRESASPENGINCKRDPKNLKAVTCNFNSHNKTAKSCVNPTTLKAMIKNICGCPDTPPLLPTQRKVLVTPPGGEPY